MFAQSKIGNSSVKIHRRKAAQFQQRALVIPRFRPRSAPNRIKICPVCREFLFTDLDPCSCGDRVEDLEYWNYVDDQRCTQPIDETKGPIMEQVDSFTPAHSACGLPIDVAPLPAGSVQRVCRPTLPWLA